METTQIKRPNIDLKGWICTDPNTDQWVKKVSETEFQVLESGEVHDINIKDYTDEEILDYISSYGYNLQTVKEIYGSDANMIIAECIAETDSIN